MFKAPLKANEAFQAEARALRALLEQELRKRLVVPMEMPALPRLPSTQQIAA